MSLKVWLPLISNTKNLGLCGDNLIASNVTFSDGGKIGNKYLSSGTITIPASISKTFFNKNHISFAFWLYPIGSTSSSVIMGRTTMSAGDNRMYSIFQYSTPNDLHLSWQDETSSSTFLGGAWSSFFPADAWTHCCIVYDGKKAMIYRNGELYTTANGTSNRNNFEYDFPIVGSPIRKLNDVRIYDHALSPLEVKHISQGLILHYPLNDNYLESTTNIITSEDCLSATCYNGALNKYGYGSNTDIYKEVTYFEGRKGTKVYNKTNGTSMLPYVYINKLFTSNGTNASEYKTLSFDYYTTISTTLYPYKLGTGSGIAFYKVINNETKTGVGTNSVSIPVKPKMWNHIEITFQGTTDANAEWGYMQNQPTHNSNTSNFWFFANMQIEEKDHATGYAGVGETRTNTIVYDTSGYGNNGEIYAYDSDGKIEITSDTPRYNMSTHVISSNTATSSAAGTTYLYGHCQLTNPSQMTVAFWLKPIKGYGDKTSQGQFCTTNYAYGDTSVGSDYQNSAMNHRDNTVNINDSGGTTQCKPIFIPTANEWHHYAITYDGQVGRLYKDGVQSSTSQFDTVKSLGSFIGVVIGFSKAGGAWRKNDSYYSDFRIYATALSAEDVKDLYELGATIDTNGVLSTYEFTEQ